ncbi:hypothetical protein PIB30_046984 [Stylosanthes scabra]|uniref:Uncharacterized protein n=1 Tax=Stylosanthes scabra TaxID=79078 RepID=A0ABU6VFE8_9FABA|nr:hypothetical protein [Stylosanthes scabra]
MCMWPFLTPLAAGLKVYVEEYGENVLSKQTHLDGISKSNESCSTCRTPKGIDNAVEFSTEVEEIPMLHMEHKAKVGADSCIDSAINANLGSAQRYMKGSGNAANRVEDDTHNERTVEWDLKVNGGVGNKENEAQIEKKMMTMWSVWIDDEERAEALKALKTKELCEHNGIHFKVRNDEDLLVRLARKKLQCKSRIDGANNRPKQGRKPVNIKGRSQSTRILRRPFADVLNARNRIVNLLKLVQVFCAE